MSIDDEGLARASHIHTYLCCNSNCTYYHSIQVFVQHLRTALTDSLTKRDTGSGACSRRQKGGGAWGRETIDLRLWPRQKSRPRVVGQRLRAAAIQCSHSPHSPHTKTFIDHHHNHHCHMLKKKKPHRLSISPVTRGQKLLRLLPPAYIISTHTTCFSFHFTSRHTIVNCSLATYV